MGFSEQHCSGLVFLLFFQLPVHKDHAVDKAYQKGDADQNYQVGGKKRHDKPGRIIQSIGCDQKMQAKKKKKTARQSKNYLAYPPKNG
jgi:hypothetical protein